VADDTAALSARVLVCALVLLAAGRAHGQAAPPDGGTVAEPAVEPGADASAGRDGASADAGAAPAPDAGGDAGPADATPANVPTTAATAAPPGPPPALLRGTVLARGGHRRIKGASVFVDGVPVAETDEEGRFSVKAAPGRRRLQAIASRYQAADVTVDVPPAGWTGEVRLTAGGQAFETVVAAKPVTPVVRIDAEAARTTPGTGGDPFRVIESLPGVSQIVWPFALYAIRGANPGNTGFFLDGMRVPALFHFALGPSIIHPYLIDKLSFYPGGYPARLGGYVSGAVAADTVAPPNDVVRFTADLRVYDAGALVTTPWDHGRGTVAVAARYAYTGLIVSRLFGDVDFGYADYQLRVDHTLGGGRATLLALGSFDHLDVKDQNIGNASLNFHRLDLRWERPVAGWQMLARTAFGTDDAKSQLYSNPIAVRAYGVSPRISFLRTLLGSAFEMGVEGEAQHFNTDLNFATGPGFTEPRPGVPALLADLARTRNASSVRAFASAVIPLGRLKVEPGLRYAEYFEQGVARGAFEPRLAVRLALTRALSVDATVGRFSQMPSLPVGVAGFEAFGLADLGLQTSTQAALGVESRLPADLSLRLTGFYQWLYVSDMRSTFDHDVTAPEFLEMRHGRGYGGELMLRLPEHARVSGWLAYTLSWSLRDFDGLFAPSDWDQRHILNLVTTVRLKDGFSVGGRVHYNTGRPYPVRPAEYERLPAFWQLDLRADKRFVLDRSTWDLYLELGNATLNQQVTALRPLDNANASEAVGFRIVLPSIGVHVEW
jgi:hypothetical protein